MWQYGDQISNRQFRGSFVQLSYEQIVKNVSQISQVVYSSVAKPPELQSLLEIFTKHSIPCKTVTTEPTSFGIVCGYPKYQNLGVDRWLAIIGANWLAPDEDLIVVDAGTAMTVDILTYDRVHKGGWIILT
ncbi:type III pantothenate kinase [Psychrosphaera algicola]|uniref:Type III pantothenate kinase n=1 Tax=Psychrosphaera algicola TaxID=3023714 RepID=A0ABT5FGV8_9GAMM|nr:type III pantothenate kinase [Psychrosphaera sp. G1-22]MDC2890212.1 type III pantothenate kinase [Psychrosphaera sp. G1-22]